MLHALLVCPRFVLPVMSDRRYTVLLRLGLLLVGLFIGILVMLLYVNQTAQPPQIVERVELGAQAANAPGQTAPVVDSARAPVLTDIMTLNQIFKEVATHVTPAVVFIEVENAPRGGTSDEVFRFDGRDAPDRFFREFRRQSVGSGVIISDEGHIITNQHVVGRAENIRVTLADKRQYAADVVGTDPSTDLAVIKVDADRPLPVAAIGNSSEVAVGEWVIAVGNPFRLTSTVTAGIVSALGRQVNIIDDAFRIEDFIQTDAAINPGNSGGALVNLDGQLVGISTAIATESGSYEGYGFAVPANLMVRVAQDLIDFGEVRRGFMGVEIAPINSRTARELGLDEVAGVYIERVTRNGAADMAGIRSGDVVMAIGERQVAEPNELQSAVAQFRPGDAVPVTVRRNGEERRLTLTLQGSDSPAYANWFDGPSDAPNGAERERAEPEAEVPDARIIDLPAWGLGLRDLTEREQSELTPTGAYVAFVERGGRASRGGLPRGGVITAVDEQSVGSAEEAQRVLNAAVGTQDRVLLRVKRPGGISAFYDIESPVEDD